jgi:uncharacterized protein
MRSVDLFQSTCQVVPELEVDALEPGIHRLAVDLVHDGAGRALRLPVLVVRGAHPGPIFGVTAAIHGDELNGIKVIQRVAHELDPAELRGTVVGCPVLNLPGYMVNERTLREGMDLNRLMPGRPDGNAGQVYAHRLMTRIINRFNYLVDLHTASFGRVNALYVRANMHFPVPAKMAMLQSPQIIVHNESDDGTLRRAAMLAGIAAITVEVGNPLLFQRELIIHSLRGVQNVLRYLEMIPGVETVGGALPVVCRRSYWIYTQHGGVLDVGPEVTERVAAGDCIARVTNLFGDLIAEYHAPEDGIVIGRSTNPVCETGARVLHLGVIGTPEPQGA